MSPWESIPEVINAAGDKPPPGPIHGVAVLGRFQKFHFQSFLVPVGSDMTKLCPHLLRGEDLLTKGSVSQGELL